MWAFIRDRRDFLAEFAVCAGFAAMMVGLTVWWRGASEEQAASIPTIDEPAGCPLVSSLDGYTEHARALIGRDEGRKAYPRTVRIYTAPDGSWIIAYDPIGTGEYACIADQGVGFRVQTSERRR